VVSAQEIEHYRQSIDVTLGDGAEVAYTDALTDEQAAMLRRRFLGVAVFLAGPANVVLQLSNYPVGRGVLESTVDSGSVYKHPFKRFRTTIGYIDIALFGDDQLRADYRHAVNGAHRQVRSTASSPVKYNAFNRNLQLWVASCLYYALRDTSARLYGPLTDAEEEVLLEASARLGTTLQVPRDMWHTDRRAFEAYWAEGLRQAYLDDETRAYLRGVVDSDILPPRAKLLKMLGQRPLRFFNTGCLPPELREQLGLSWTERDERVFNLALRVLGFVSRPFPFAFRRTPANWMSWNLRIRRALRKPMI
jgi:uncharacterized protein (DUF2236 family)